MTKYRAEIFEKTNLGWELHEKGLGTKLETLGDALKEGIEIINNNDIPIGEDKTLFQIRDFSKDPFNK